MRSPNRCVGLTIDRWGPSCWNTLHTFAHASPERCPPERRRKTRKMLYLVGEHLPCAKCRTHFLDYLERHLTDEALAGREALVRFLNDCHNDVNRRLGKRTYTLREHYDVYFPPARVWWRRTVPSVCVTSTVAVLVVWCVAKKIPSPRHPPLTWYPRPSAA